MLQHQLPVGIRDATNMWGGERMHKSPGHDKYSLYGIKKTFTKVEAHAGMEERLVRDL